MSKPRSDATLKTLHPLRMLQLWQWLSGDPVKDLPPLSQAATIAKIKEAWGLDTSGRALSEFYVWYPFRERLKAAADFQNDALQFLKEHPEIDLDSDKVSKLWQMMAEKLAIDAEDSKLFIALRRVRQKDVDQASVNRRIAMLEKQTTQAKEKLTEVVRKGGLSDEALREIEIAANILS